MLNKSCLVPEVPSYNGLKVILIQHGWYNSIRCMYKYLYTANKRMFLVQYNNSPSDIQQEGHWKQIVVASWHWRLFCEYSKNHIPFKSLENIQPRAISFWDLQGSFFSNNMLRHSRNIRNIKPVFQFARNKMICFFVCFFGSYLVVWICKRSHERDRYFGIPRLNPKPLGPKPFAELKSFWIKGQSYWVPKSVPNKNHRNHGPSIYNSKKQNTIFGGSLRFWATSQKWLKSVEEKLPSLKLT